MPKFWEKSSHPTKTISATAIAEWETQHGLAIPALLRTAMTAQNGGHVANTISPKVHIDPIHEWELFDDAEWLEAADFIGKADKLISFASNDHSTRYFLDFNRPGPDGEPQVLTMVHDPDEFLEDAQSVAGWLAAVAKRTGKPAVDAAYASKLTKIGEGNVSKGQYRSHQLLGRDGAGQLVLVENTNLQNEEQWSAMVIPEPIRRAEAKVVQGRWYGAQCYELHLAPVNRDGIQYTSSDRLPTGNWKNAFCTGVPVYTTLRDTSRENVEAIRAKLVGSTPQAEPMQEAIFAGAEKLRAEFESKLATLPKSEVKYAEFYVMHLQNIKAMEGFDSLFADVGVELDSPMADLAPLMSQSVTGIADPGEKLDPGLADLIRRMVEAEHAAEEAE